MLDVQINISLTVSTNDFGRMRPGELHVFFDDTERILKAIKELSAAEMEIRVHNNGHDRKEATSGTRS